MAFSEDAYIHQPKQRPPIARTGPQSNIVGGLDAMLQARVIQRYYKRAQSKRMANGGVDPLQS